MKTNRTIEALMQAGEYHLGRLVNTLATRRKLKKVTKYLSPHVVLKATRVHKFDGRNRQESLVVTVGAPNFQERKFIKTLKAAGEPFPVRKIQIKLEK